MHRAHRNEHPVTRSIFPTGFDGEIQGAFYGNDRLDRQLDTFLAGVAEHDRREVADVADLVENKPGFWQQIRPLLDDLAERGARRRFVLQVDVQVVARAQRAHIDSVLGDLDDPQGGRSVGWREDMVAGMLRSLAVDPNLPVEQRERYQRMLEAVNS